MQSQLKGTSDVESHLIISLHENWWIKRIWEAERLAYYLLKPGHRPHVGRVTLTR